MAFNFEELTCQIRLYMLYEFLSEWFSDNPYISKQLSEAGVAAFPKLMCQALLEGDQQSLCESLSLEEYWKKYRDNAVKMLSYSEFNIWYIRGLSKRLLDEGVEYCEIYKAAPSSTDNSECAQYENQLISVLDVYNGHRIRYHGPNKDHAAFSIPAGPWCHHTIRRVVNVVGDTDYKDAEIEQLHDILDAHDSGIFRGSFRMTYGNLT